MQRKLDRLCRDLAIVHGCRGLNTHNFRPDFMTFNHRGKVLPHVLPPDHPLTASVQAGSVDTS